MLHIPIPRIFHFCLLIPTALFFISIPEIRAESGITPLDRMDKALSRAIHSQQEMDQWLEEKESMLQALLEDELRLERLRYQEKKYLAQIQREHETLTELGREQQEMERMLIELEPELAARVDALEEFILTDLPFLETERRERITMLRTSLLDHRLGLDQKLQRILEAYLIETGYGRDVETVTRSIILQSEPTTVRVFRLGRLGLYFLSMDNTRGGRWDHVAKKWTLLPTSMIRALSTAIDISQRRRAAELVELPVGRP